MFCHTHQISLAQFRIFLIIYTLLIQIKQCRVDIKLYKHIYHSLKEFSHTKCILVCIVSSFELMSTKLIFQMIQKYVSFNPDTISDLSAHRCSASIPGFLSKPQIMSKYIQLCQNTQYFSTLVFTKFIKMSCQLPQY